MKEYQIFVTGVASIYKKANSEEEAMAAVTKEDLRNIDWESIECDYAEEIEE